MKKTFKKIILASALSSIFYANAADIEFWTTDTQEDRVKNYSANG